MGASTPFPEKICGQLSSPPYSEEHEPKLARLRAALIEGERSGNSEQTVDDIWEAVKRRRNAEQRTL